MYKRNIAVVGGMRNVNIKVGRMIAEELEMNTVLVEDTIEYVNNSDIPSLVRDFGTEYYYALEDSAIDDIVNRCDNSVIATTGTMALNVPSIEKLKKVAYIILLTADDETTLRRIDKDRMCFLKDDLLEKSHSLLRNIAIKIAPLSDAVIDTTRILPDAAVSLAISRMEDIIGNE